jgi:phage-related minor tail protein
MSPRVERMNLGDIAGLIAAGVFAVLVGLLAIPLVKLGGLFDEARDAIRELSDGVTPLLEETTQTIAESNKQLARLDTITTDVAEVTGNINALVTLIAATVGGPLIKLAGFTAGVRAAIIGGRRSKAASTAKLERIDVDY